MSQLSQYSTCIHLTNDLIIHALTLSPKLTVSYPWICCHCNKIFATKSEQYDHYMENSKTHYLYLSYRSLRNEIYCASCQDFQYSSLFDQYTGDVVNSYRKNSHRIIGFINMGSTCFLSSVLQVLLSNPILIRFFDISELFVHNCKTLSYGQQQPQQSCPLCLYCELSKLFKIVNKYTWFTLIPSSSSFCRRKDGTEIAAAVPSEVLCTIWTTSRHLAHYEQHDAHELLIALLDTLGQHLQFNHGDHNLIHLIPNTPVKSEIPILQNKGLCHSPRSWSEEIQESTHDVHCLHTDIAPPAETVETHTLPSSMVTSFPPESTKGLNYVFRGIVNEVCLSAEVR